MHNFNTPRGLFHSAARDLHVHYCNHTDRRDDSQHQPQTADTPPPVPSGTFVVQKNPGKCADIPLELLDRILNWLDLPSMLRCRYVCSIFRDLIDSSPYFQWDIELAIAGKEDSAAYPLAESRRMLVQHQRGWADLLWTKELFVQATPDRRLLGGVITYVSDDDSTTHFKRMPSQSRNIEERDWTVDIRRFNWLSWEIEPTQDLLLVVTAPQRSQSSKNYQIFLLTASTGDPHPLTSGIFTHTAREQLRLEDLKLCEDILCLQFATISDPGEMEFAFSNWKTGTVLANVLSDYPTDVAFISQNHVMFGVQKPKEPSLIVVDITALTSGRRQLQEMENRFTFHLPPFADTVQRVKINIRSDGAPAFKSNFPVPFFTAREPRNCLLIVTLLVRTEDLLHQVHLYALSHTFLSLIDMAAGQNTVDFDWRMWGPEGTRMILALSTSFGSALVEDGTFPSGTRHACTGRPTTEPVDRIHIYDFNQYALRRSEQNNKENTAGQREAKTPLSYANVTAPTKIVDYDIFQDEIETRLGYRTKCWVIPGEPKVRYPVCDEDCIAIWEEESQGYHVFTV